MARRGPSLTALLGLLAVAGYQHRDKISDLLGRMQSSDAEPGSSSGIADQVKSLIGGAPAGAGLASAFSELMDMFRGTPHEAPARSWVAEGQNTPVAPAELADVIGDDTLRDLSEKTGMSRDALLAALSERLPAAIDGMTPHGRLPSDDEARDYI